MRILIAIGALALADGAYAQQRAACASTQFVAPPAPYANAVVAARRAVCTRLVPHVPGGQIAVAVGDRIIWSEGFGYADIEQRHPVRQTTMYRIGSVSKSLTADAVVQLAVQRKLDLDAEVQRYVPAFPRKRWPITVRQVAGHLSGIRHYRTDPVRLKREYFSTKYFSSVTDALSMFAADTLNFEPGTQWGYSTYGYTLLSAAVEGAANQEFLAYLGANVFRPLGMKNTAADKVDSLIPERAQAYDLDSSGRGPFKIAARVDNSYKWAGGGMLSSAEDLARFGLAHLSPGYLSADALALLFTPMKTRAGRPTDYGIGWVIRSDVHQHRLVTHDGGAVGGASELFVDRDAKIVVAIVVNLTSDGAAGQRSGRLIRDIHEMFEPRRP